MLYSSKYLEQQRLLHQNPDYGSASLSYAPLVLEIVHKIGAKSISDYGAGKCRLKKKFIELGKKNFNYYPYDPVFPEYGQPKAADLVCCIDVLEHIEPLYLTNVLVDLAKITINVGFFTIHTGPAVKYLPDGRNAHLIQKPVSWWLPQISEKFEIIKCEDAGSGFWVLTKSLSNFQNKTN